jgi:hypothetical protein
VAFSKLGWAEPVQTLMAFHSSVRTIARGKHKFRERLDAATFPLTRYYSESDCPEYVRNKISNIMKVRTSVRVDYGQDTCIFHFKRLTPKKKEQSSLTTFYLYMAHYY